MTDKAVSKLIDKILLDPMLLRKLSDRVYEVMQEDLRKQRERSGDYKRLF